MARSKAVLLLPLLALAPLQALACYTVYQADRVVYYGDQPPVDMSRPLHETVPVRFPGGHMVFDSAPCPVPTALAFGASRSTDTTSSPLLTDERTARAMNAAYRPLGGGVVVVEQKDAKLRPGVTVLPASRPAAQAPVRAAPPVEESVQPQQQNQQQPRY
jgi:hypothetical protein